MINTSDDIGIAILEYLCVEKKGRVGYFFSMNEWLNGYLASKQRVGGLSEYNTLITSEVIKDLVRQGFVQVISEVQLHAYGHLPQSGLPAGVELAITWAGKGWYKEHVEKGVLSKTERRLVLIAIMVSAIGSLATLAQLLLSLCSGPTSCPQVHTPMEVVAPATHEEDSRIHPHECSHDTTIVVVAPCCCDDEQPKPVQPKRRVKKPCPCPCPDSLRLKE